MADVNKVAEFFIHLANLNEDDPMTNLKLNKLLYFAQGAFLARTGQPLFSSEIEAWPLGPVVPEVYHKYKVCGKNPIFSDEDISSTQFAEDERDAMFDVMIEYGQYTGAKLVSLTHQDNTPWSNTRKSGEKVIDKSLIRDYFIACPVPRLQERIASPIVSILPADWYDPAEDADWEAYS